MPDDTDNKPAEPNPQEAEKGTAGNEGGTAVATKPLPKRPPSKLLPPWKVLLHNDDVNEMPFVVMTIIELTPLKEPEAILRTTEAHHQGVALLLVTHKERAELYKDQFESKGLTVTIEPDEE